MREVKALEVPHCEHYPKPTTMGSLLPDPSTMLPKKYEDRYEIIYCKSCGVLRWPTRIQAAEKVVPLPADGGLAPGFLNISRPELEEPKGFWVWLRNLFSTPL